MCPGKGVLGWSEQLCCRAAVSLLCPDMLPVSCHCASPSGYDDAISTGERHGAAVTGLPAGPAQSCSGGSLRHGTVQVC